MPRIKAHASRAKIRDARIDVRMTSDTKEKIVKAALLRDISLSDFMLNGAQREADNVLAAHQTIQLGERDSAAFAEALAHPPAPNERLRQAARDYRALYGE